MSHKSHTGQLSTWGIPAVYAAVAIAAALTFPRFESRIFPGLVSPVSVSTATAIYSSIASGMIALTGIVFSLTFVMVQFSATAYSPRLVLWIARDPVMSHALGMLQPLFSMPSQHSQELTGMIRGKFRLSALGSWLLSSWAASACSSP